MPSERHPSKRSNYLDFELEIGVGRGREYPVALLDSPAGAVRATLRFPFDELALENRLLTLQNALLRSGGEPRRTLSEEEQDVLDFGRALFEALFTSEVRSCYDVSLREAEQQALGLRLKLRIQSPELTALPWEFLYHPGQAEYVSLSTQTPIVRYLEVPQRIQPLAVAPPLRILGLIASPSDQPALDVAREQQRIESAIHDLRARGLVDLEWLPGQTWRDLQRAMRHGPWHIFHFIGHGGFDRRTGEGLILLADREGQAARFGATQLGRLLDDHASLRLVLLNACEGARGSERDVFSSTAAILVRRGIPAVVAMQYAITDRAAIEFARTFYEALGDGMPVDGAVAEARKAISFAVANTVEWGTPVLYMRSPDGVLFEVSGPPPETPPPSRAAALSPEAQGEREQQLESLYVDGLSAFWVEDWDRARRCFRAIVDERPDYRDASARLQEAERQRTMGELYAQAQTARTAGDWAGALSALEDLVAKAPEFKDAPALLERARREVQLADLYAQARQLHQAGRWQAAVNVFARIAALDPDYPDPEGLLPSAQEEVAAKRRQAELRDLYHRAVLAIDAGCWSEARGLLAQVQEHEPGYREAERLLARAEAEIGQEDEEQRRQERITALYEAARQSARAGQWPQALATMDEIHCLDPDFTDPDELATRAQAMVERQEKEARRDDELAALYAQAVSLLRAGQYQAALDKWDQLRARNPQYPDQERVVDTARKKLARRVEPADRHRLPRWAWAAIAGLASVVVVVVSLSVIVPAIIPAPESTSTPTPEQTEIPAPPQEGSPESTVVPPLPTPTPKVISFAWTQDPDTLNPYYTSKWYSAVLQQMYNCWAWEFDDKYEAFPRLLTDLPTLDNGGINEDGTILTLTLRDDIVWSDGAPITGDDFVFTYEMIVYSGNSVASTYPYDQLVSVEATDERTVVMHFTEPLASWQSSLWHGLLPKHILEPVFEASGSIDEAEWNLAPTVGCGPYNLAEWDSGSFLRFTKNPNYWLGQPRIDEIYLLILPEDASHTDSLVSGEADLGTFVPLSDVPSLQEAGVEIVTITSGWAEGWFFNYGDTDNPGARDVRLRRAVAMALDRERITSDLGLGLARPVETLWYALPGYESPDIQPWEFDPWKASRLLDEAGYVDTDGDGWREIEGKPLTLRHGTTTREIRQNIQEMAQKMLMEVGIDLQVQNWDADIFFGNYTNGSPAALGELDIMQWSDRPSNFPDPDLQYWLCSEIPSDENPWGTNYFGCDEYLDGLFRMQATMMDAEERTKVIQEITEYMHDNVYWIGLYDDLAYWGLGPRVIGAKFSGVTPFYSIMEWDLRE